MKILKLSRISLAAWLLFSVCNQASADSTGNPDLSQLAQDLPATASCRPVPPSPQCPHLGVWTCNLPVYWDRADSPTFPYSFQIQLATERGPDTPPLGIVINGGAGAPSIGFEPGRIFPPTFNVIYTDVRGVGCNNIDPDHPFPANALTTNYFSRDVLAVIQFLQLTDYVLFGVSYGTVQATVMANIAQNEGIQTPRALVLEGILGIWSINEKEVVDYNKEWTYAKTLLPPDVVSHFQETSPYGIPSADWMTFLSSTLNEGATPEHHGNSTAYFLRPLGDPEKIAGALETIRTKVAEIRAGIKPETSRVASILHCTETQRSIYVKDLVNGEIVNTGPDLCPPNSFIRPYDSAQYPVTVPIYYFEGSQDPNTSPANAAHHFNNQTQAPRAATLVWGGGHTDMSGTLHQRGCTPAIFTAIARNPPGLDAALRQCNWPMTFTFRPAGQ